MNREYKKFPSAKNILGDFWCIQFFYCTSGCTSKSQNWRGWIKLPCVFTHKTKDTSVSTWQDTRFLFLLVWFFFLSSVTMFKKKCVNSTQRSQLPNSWGWPLFSAKSKIYSPWPGYLSPGNAMVLEIAAALLFISVTNSCQFWGSLHWNSSTLPRDLFIFMIYASTAGLLAPWLTLLQPSYIVCSALTVQYHNNKHQPNRQMFAWLVCKCQPLNSKSAINNHQ